jgi:hypothetical protein
VSDDNAAAAGTGQGEIDIVPTLPDYQGGSIVNLMSSLITALQGAPNGYPPARSLPPDELNGAPNIVLLVIDGLGQAFLEGAGRDSALRAYMRAPLTSVFPPTTATAIPAFLTGVAPQQHGFTGWFTHFRELGAIVAPLPFRARLGGAPLCESGISPALLCGERSVFDRLRAHSFSVMPEWIAHSCFNRAFSGSATIRPYRTLTELFAMIRACVRRRCEGRAYVYAYWPGLDQLAHEHGIGSEAVRAHFGEIDAGFKDLAESLRRSGTTLIVTADHGFIDTAAQHEVLLAEHPRLAETLTLPLCGEPRAAYCYVHPQRRGGFEDYVHTRLAHCATLHESETLLARGWYGTGQRHPRVADRIGHYALLMKGDYVIRDWIIGEKPYHHIGVHGGTSVQEMHVPLIVVAG